MLYNIRELGTEIFSDMIKYVRVIQLFIIYINRIGIHNYIMFCYEFVRIFLIAKCF